MVTDRRTNVFIVAEHQLGIRALRSLIDPQDDLRCVGETTIASTAARVVRTRDLRRVVAVAAGSGGELVCVEGFALALHEITELLGLFRGHSERLPVLVVTESPPVGWEGVARWPDTHTVLGVGADLDLVVYAIRLVGAGYSIRRGSSPAPGHLAPADARPVVPEPVPVPDPTFTGQEREVLVQLAQGMTNGEIATATGLSDQIVKSYLQRMRVRLGLDNRASLAAHALQLGAARSTRNSPSRTEARPS